MTEIPDPDAGGDYEEAQADAGHEQQVYLDAKVEGGRQSRKAGEPDAFQ
jgi:hypothetical protein